MTGKVKQKEISTGLKKNRYSFQKKKKTEEITSLSVEENSISYDKYELVISY